MGTSCSDKIDIKKLKKKVKKSEKQLTEVKNTTQSFIDRMKLDKQNDLFQRTYNLYKKQLIIMIRKEIYNGFIPTLNNITEEKLKADVNVSSYKSINEQQSEIDSTNTILAQISTKAYDTSIQYDKVVDANKFQINNYKRNDIKRKKVLYKFYKELYKYYTGGSKIKFSTGKKDFDYRKHNLMSEIFHIKHNTNGQKGESYIKNLSIKRNSKAEIIAFYKVELGEDGNESVKSLETIEKMKKEKEYKNNNKLYKYEKKFAKCQKQFREKIKAHNELYESMNKLIEEDNNLQRNMSNMATHFRNIKIRIGNKADEVIEKLFKMENGKYSSDITKDCIRAIFYLAPIKFDAELEEKHKAAITKYKDNIKDNVINYSLLKEIEDDLNQINTIVQQIENQEHRTKIVLDLNRAKNIFKHCTKLYSGIKSDLQNFKDSFLFIGQDKSKDINDTIYLLKIINSIIKSHYEGIMALFKLKCYMEVFLKEEYRKKFTGLLSVTEQWTNDPMKRIQYEQGMRKSVQPNYIPPIQTNYPQQNMIYPNKVTMLGGAYSKNNISKKELIKNNPNISYIYGYVNILETPLDSSDYNKIKYENIVDKLEFPFNYPIKESPDQYRITTKSIKYLIQYYGVTDIGDHTIKGCINLINNIVEEAHHVIIPKISNIITNNDYIFNPFEDLENSILNFFYFINTYNLEINEPHAYITRFSKLTVCSIIMKKILYDNFKNNEKSITTNTIINIFELEGEIDNFFNWFIYVNKLINNLTLTLKKGQKQNKKKTIFYENYYNKQIQEIKEI